MVLVQALARILRGRGQLQLLALAWTQELQKRLQVLAQLLESL